MIQCLSLLIHFILFFIRHGCFVVIFYLLYHLQVTFASKSIDATLNLLKPGECVVSYLPLSHIAGLCVDLFCPIYSGGTVYFAQPDALKVS